MDYAWMMKKLTYENKQLQMKLHQLQEENQSYEQKLCGSKS